MSFPCLLIYFFHYYFFVSNQKMLNLEAVSVSCSNNSPTVSLLSVNSVSASLEVASPSQSNVYTSLNIFSCSFYLFLQLYGCVLSGAIKI